MGAAEAIVDVDRASRGTVVGRVSVQRRRRRHGDGSIAAFQVKVGFLLVAGVNVAAFYWTMFKTVRNVGPGEQAPLFARIIGGVSLCSWIGVMTAGRLLTFYRPL